MSARGRGGSRLGSDPLQNLGLGRSPGASDDDAPAPDPEALRRLLGLHLLPQAGPTSVSAPEPAPVPEPAPNVAPEAADRPAAAVAHDGPARCDRMSRTMHHVFQLAHDLAPADLARTPTFWHAMGRLAALAATAERDCPDMERFLAAVATLWPGLRLEGDRGPLPLPVNRAVPLALSLVAALHGGLASRGQAQAGEQVRGPDRLRPRDQGHDGDDAARLRLAAERSPAGGVRLRLYGSPRALDRLRADGTLTTLAALARAGGASFTITTTEHCAELALLG